ncbi:hypothetical protein EVAR_75250_1 [Eumeta japonica]|uniref:Uncharacterized protein n=1 Tax=Eumeta variegata TaxID=151549 RepID=A0A4C1V9S6_EUMVA|nr:hypothetical protein EVAR_75250_1 [Eumeta japonica]
MLNTGLALHAVGIRGIVAGRLAGRHAHAQIAPVVATADEFGTDNRWGRMILERWLRIRRCGVGRPTRWADYPIKVADNLWLEVVQGCTPLYLGLLYGGVCLMVEAEV